MEEKRILEAGYAVITSYKGAWSSGEDDSGADGVLVVVDAGCEEALNSFQNLV
jgi:hypothetical protein